MQKADAKAELQNEISSQMHSVASAANLLCSSL